MNKLIFQIGILAFFISIVIFGVQQFSLFDTLARAFIVFITVVLFGILLVVFVTYIHEKNETTKQSESHNTAAHSVANNE
ncbi:MAG: hypothetical protein N3A63_05580 [Bacteroidetes bacterium]|nr:hypothetical protein [Bacteroidota bacterium]